MEQRQMTAVCLLVCLTLSPFGERQRLQRAKEGRKTLWRLNTKAEPPNFQTGIQCQWVQKASAASSSWWAPPGPPVSLQWTELSHIALKSKRNDLSQPRVGCPVRNPIQITWNKRKEESLPTSHQLSAEGSKDAGGQGRERRWCSLGYNITDTKLQWLLTVSLLFSWSTARSSSTPLADSTTWPKHCSCQHHSWCSAHMYSWGGPWLNT